MKKQIRIKTDSPLSIVLSYIVPLVFTLLISSSIKGKDNNSIFAKQLIAGIAFVPGFNIIPPLSIGIGGIFYGIVWVGSKVTGTEIKP